MINLDVIILIVLFMFVMFLSFIKNTIYDSEDKKEEE